jgi:TIR domain
MTAQVFVCYRRDDSAAFAGRVQDRLAQEFGRDLLFMDVDAIPLGVNFVTALHEAVAKCEVLLAVIGPNWLEARDDAGTRRLDDPNDFVRIEIGAALQRSIPVIPILLESAKVPKANQLPEDLKELAMRNWLEVHHASFHSDLDKLVRGLKTTLGQDEQRRVEEEQRRQDEFRRDLEQKSAAELQPSRRISRLLRDEFEAAPRRTQSEQRAPQPVKPWLLPAIGAIAASLPAVVMSYLPLGGVDSTGLYIAVVANALYGIAAGMLVLRFGILKAIAIPIVPVGVVTALTIIVIRLMEERALGAMRLVEPALAAMRLEDDASKIATSSIWGIAFTWLAFWLYLRWLRKRQMN